MDFLLPQQVTTEEDVALIEEYRQGTKDPAVRKLLDELIPLLERARFVRVGTGTSGGSTEKIGAKNPGSQEYKVKYVRGVEGNDRIALLVHELTHIAADVAYGSDMLNYPVPEYAGEGLEGGSAEEKRQRKRLGLEDEKDKDKFQRHVLSNVNELLELLPGSGLPDGKQEEVRDKLIMKSAANPFHEYDAILSHCLVWCDGYPETEGSEFRKRLVEMVRDTQRWRQDGLRSRQGDRQWRDRWKESVPTQNETFDKLMDAVMKKASETRSSKRAATSPAAVLAPRIGAELGSGLRGWFWWFLGKLRRLFPWSGRR
ncbi:hypothetical protein [Saccharopolyspora sp. NPDC002376]